MHQAVVCFLLGMAAPSIVKKARPYAMGSSDRALRVISRKATQMREDLEDFVAEAAAEVDAKRA